MKKMKNMKKVVSILLALVLALGLTITAFADNDTATITIKNAATGAVYNAYKIFDATENDEGKPSYTIPAGSEIAKSDVQVPVSEEEDAKEVGFTDIFATTNNGGETYVSRKQVADTENEGQYVDAVSDDVVIAWLKAYVENSNLTVTTSKTASSATVTLDVTPGYYYIVSSLNSDTAVAVKTASSNVTIYDKRNGGPSIDPGDDPDDPDDGQGKKINGHRVADMEVGESGDFTVAFNATNYTVDEEGNAKQITKYTVTDTPDGFEIDKTSVKVTAGGAPLNSGVDTTIDSNGVMKVEITWPEDTYDSPVEVVVSYTATLTDKHLAGDSTNAAVVKYTTEDGDIEIPDPHGETHTYNHSVAISKVDAADESIYLAGAQFVLSRDNNGTIEYYAYNETTKDVSWVTDIKDATVKITKEEDETTEARELGTAVFVGLEAGTYTLTETKAPAGYNLAEPETFTLDEIETELQEGEEEQDLVYNITVKDKTGSVLPTTGGMGTTLFYIIGGILVAGAAVLLVTRRRMSN